MKNIRNKVPIKSYTGIRFTTNKTNKKYLAKDFENKCAYCGDLDNFSGGKGNYHVEHFAPKSKFSAYEFDYDNLLYSCPFCNLSKSDKWPSDNYETNIVGNEGFVNPCDSNYYKHLKRDDSGKIVAIDDIGKYMFRELSLGLCRHQYIYILEDLNAKLSKIEQLLNNNDYDPVVEVSLRSILVDLRELYTYYSRRYHRLI